MSIRIGTSGWVYSHWRGVFYPPELRPRDWFALFSRTFDDSRDFVGVETPAGRRPARSGVPRT